MRIALLGYGKMGKTIEKIALSRGHEIVLKIEGPDQEIDLSAADVAIDFSVPNSAAKHLKAAFDQNVPVVCGTTGWLQDYDKIIAYCNEKKGAFIYASNFSLGVNIFFELNKKLSRIMYPYQDYKVSVNEIHHTEKLDAPSGTAITLAEGIISSSEYDEWQLVEKGQRAGEFQLPISAERIPEVPGTHTVSYDSEIDSIEITHTAHNREGFALGAVVAAEWLEDREGVFSMRDVIFE